MSLSKNGVICLAGTKAMLVTGAGGFIGSRLCAKLENRGFPVVRQSLSRGDLSSAVHSHPDLARVYHLAARTSVVESWSATPAFYQANVMGTVSVLEFCRQRCVPLTMISSYVYGTPERLPIAEDQPLRAYNPYSHTKIVAEAICGYYAEQFGVAVTVVRPFNIYGPGQRREFLIPTLVEQAVDPACEKIGVQDIRPKRDFLFVEDLVDLLLKTHWCPPGTYNAGSGISVSIGELVEIINSQLPSPKPLVCNGPSRPTDVLDVVADISKARAELDWAPRVSLKHGLRQVMEWTRINHRGAKA